MTAQSAARFDLKRDLPIRVVLCRRSSHNFALLVVVHHIAADLWSFGIILRDLASAYQQSNRETTPPQLQAAQFASYALWQQQMLAGPAGDRLQSFWLEELRGDLPVLHVLNGSTRPPAASNEGGEYFFTVEPQVTARVLRFCRENQVTPYALLLSVFQTLLHRWTGQAEILSGTPTTGRSRPEFADVVGYFVNPVVMRTSFRGSPTFREILDRNRNTVIRALTHQEYPFPMLVERLQPIRDMSHAPLFQNLFSFQKAGAQHDPSISAVSIGLPGEKIRFGEIDLELMSLPTNASQCDVTLMMAQRRDDLVGVFKYDRRLLDEDLVSQLAAQYVTLLSAALENPDRRLLDYQLLTQRETAEAVVASEGEHAPVTAEYLHEAFERTARLTPDAIAVSYEDLQLTFSTVNASANHLARALRKSGAGPERCVLIAAPRCAEWIVGALAVLKAGGAFVAADPTVPPAYLQAVIQQTSPVAALVRDTDMTRIDGVQAVYLSLLPGFNDHTDDLDDVNVRPDNLAYIMYTSGTTGAPMGVLVTHRSLMNLRAALRTSVYGSSHPGRLTMNAPLWFDSSIKQLLMLPDGCDLHIVPQHVRLDGRRFVDYLSERSMDTLDCTPSQLRVLIEQGLLDRELPSTLLAGGEMIEETLWQQLGGAQGKRCFNVYGPTECTVDAACSAITRLAPPNIGRPLLNMRALVLDAGLQPASVGAVGELYIGGAGVARGYCGQPAETASRFIPDPLSGELGARLYRTGDKARRTKHGSIELLGRSDRQVKIRGYRIDAGAVESAISRHPGVRDCVVTTSRPTDGDLRLLAFVTRRPGNLVSAEELMDFLRGQVPHYMLPSGVAFLDALPLNSNGKVDEQALPSLHGVRPESVGQIVAPRNRVEEAIAEHWKRLLGAETVGVFDNFFELGGHSLLVTSMIGQIQDAFPTEVPLIVLFFENPTVAGLAEAIGQAAQDDDDASRLVEELSKVGASA